MDPIVEQDPRRAVARLAVAVMAADGRITSPEIAALERLDGLGLGSLGQLIEEELERATHEAIDVRSACAALAGASREAAHTLLAVLADIATCDRVLAGRERETYDGIARLLGVPERESAHILAAAAERPGAGTPVAPAGRRETAAPGVAAEGMAAAPRRPAAGGADGEDAAALLARAQRVLGVGPEASREEIDAAYVAAASRYNPVAVSAMGADFVALAVRRLADATAAWELLAAGQGD